MNEQFDAIVIGTGQAGPSLAVRLAQSGKKTAIIERNLYGGTCVNVGCTPTKTLVASARAAHMARHAEAYGVMIDGTPRVDMARVKARMDAVVRQSSDGVRKWLHTTPGLTVIEGHARFVSNHAVTVNSATLEAPQIFINAGGRAAIPDIPGLTQAGYLTSSTILELDHLPEHLLIIGGSYIGLEFAQMYRRFGSAVTVFEAGPHLIGREEAEVSLAVQQILEGEGIRFHFNASKMRISGAGNVRTLHAECDSSPVDSSGSHVLIGAGRMPNTDDLGLEQTDIVTDKRGYIVVDDRLATNVPGIFALGDVNGRGAFTHTAYNDYEILAANLLDDDPRRLSDRIPVYALYTDPPLARIGMDEKEARASGKRILKGKMMMSRVARARERGETDGFMQVLVDADTKKILGATLLGIEADEVIHLLLDVMYAGAPYTVIQRAMHIHPTVAELIPTLLGDLKPLEA
ncbi:FAD-containing oxidoreductase [Noviherbaspirillum sp. Root189]|uniref:FAD-containing oxidoreductase n=1 Tax=Noviherbaspirillum sp. Root189 TaxID=1736487 RepID=UPI0007096E90|nr:FAD-containing oxidoreductase [Noviherbaspirillum sp. Root189]KRB87427.1 mercuric reductase [Noviherbaspirillum sp. Root189]